MFLKRLSAIIMLIEGKSTYNIQKTLKISISTVLDIKTKFELNQYEHLVDRYNDKKFNAEAFVKVIEKILDAGMPSLGKDRWKSLR
jgi:transposase